MNNRIIEAVAALSIRSGGPQRYYPGRAKDLEWGAAELGRRLLTVMGSYGLDERDAYLDESSETPTFFTDVGYLFIDDATLVAHDQELRKLCASVAMRVSHERMLRMSGWVPGDEIPDWGLIVSDTLARRLEAASVSPVELWNSNLETAEDGGVDRLHIDVAKETFPGPDPRSALPTDCSVARHDAGMLFSWDEDELSYHENYRTGAILYMPRRLLDQGRTDALVGARVGEVVQHRGALRDALAAYEILEVTMDPATAGSDTKYVTLLLDVQTRTLRPIPAEVIQKSGIVSPAGQTDDMPLWKWATADQLASHTL